MVNLDTYIVNISLPSIAKYFNISSGEVSWVVLSYVLIITSTLLIFGKLGDLIGIKKIFLIGFSVFTAGSVFCGLSGNLGWLVISRGIQGIGGSILYSVTPAMVPSYLPHNRRGRAFGFMSTMAALGISLGTPLGGLISGMFSWQWIFLINLPIGIIAIWIGLKILPPDQQKLPHLKDFRFDYWGVTLSAIGFFCFIFALTEGRKMGWLSIEVLALLIVSAVLIFLFILVEKKVKEPLLDLNLFKNKEFTYSNIAGGLATAYLAGHNFLIPFYMENIKGLKPEQSGLMIMFYSVVYMIVCLFAGRASDTIHPRKLCLFALSGVAISVFSFSFSLGFNGLLPVIIYFILLGFSFAFFFSPNNKMIIGSAEPGTQGIVSGVYRMFSRLSMAIGVCLFEIVFTSTHGFINNSSSLNAANFNKLLDGFRYSYLMGGGFCLIAIFFTLLAISKKNIFTV
jgi:EmrB/QacA subfamily drug resistance transporter